MKTLKNLFLGLVLATVPLIQAFAQTFPTRTVTIVVPFPPGGPTDPVARLIATGLEQMWKQPVVIENRAGASGLIGARTVATSRPDGHTLLFTGQLSSTKVLFKEGAEVVDALQPVINAVWTPMVMVTNPSVPAKTVREFVDYAKTKPKQLNVGTIANTGFDLDVQLFLQKSGIDLALVPYNGATPATLAAIRNELSLWFIAPVVAQQHVTAGTLIPLAVTGATRYSGMPNVPTVKEGGVDFTAGFGLGLFAPAKTPDEVVNQIARDVATVMKTETVAARIKQFGFETPLTGPKAWAAELDNEAKAYGALAAKLGVKPQ